MLPCGATISEVILLMHSATTGIFESERRDDQTGTAVSARQSILRRKTPVLAHLIAFRKIWKQNKNDVEALKFIVHFSADLFQPMHRRLSDRGGNDVMIKWFVRDIRLHQLWDTQMLEGQKFSYSEYSSYLKDKFAKQKKNSRNNRNPRIIWETYLLMENKIYGYDYENLRAYNYLYEFNEDMDRQLFRAGIQLANLLNQIF